VEMFCIAAGVFIFVIYLLCRISPKFMYAVFYIFSDAVIGTALASAVNMLFNLGIGINIFSVSIFALLGFPGFVLILLLKFL